MAADVKIEPGQVKDKKIIGKVGTNPVWEVVTKGGFYVNLVGKGAGFEILSTGPHRAIARHIAMERNPNMELTDLSKSNWLSYEDYAPSLPKWRLVTALLVDAVGDIEP